MGQGKKKRGKQRKAAKSKAPVPDESDEAVYEHWKHPSNQIDIIKAPDGAYFHPTYHKLAALFVEKGDAAITDVMADLTDEVLAPGKPNISLVQSGILSTVLNFLGRCENETFDMVMAGARGHVLSPDGVFIPNMGGDLVSPVTWIDVLSKAVELEPGCRLQIAENIGPLVRCMCNDTGRLFFKSNKHWREGIGAFVELVSGMISKSINSIDGSKKVVDTLLNHEGLLTSIIQWGFYDDEHRPDIVEEVGTEFCTQIVSIGLNAVKKLVESAAYQMKDGNRILTKEGRSWLKTIGSTPIVDRDYDPTCMVSYVEGLIRAVKKEGWERNGSNICPYLIIRLMVKTDGINKGIITEVIDLGSNYDHDIKSAELVTRLASRMICIEIPENRAQPNDTRTAFAIRAGLIEMCFGFIERFYRHSSNDEELFFFTHRVFIIIHELSLHQKTAKAIRSKKITIEEKLVCLEQNTDISSYTECRDILDMVKTILRFSGSYCCRCNKQLSKTEVKQCNGCSCMVYCSRACQKEDWLNGHNVTCGKAYTADLAGQFQGSFWPPVALDDKRDARKMEDLEINMSMVQLKLFLDNSETILAQAKGLNLNLCDCLVVFDNGHPTAVDVKKYTDVFERSDEQRRFEESRSKDNITCRYYSSIYIGNRKGDVARQRLFPHEWLTKQSK